jgi:hypothetical protein
MNIVDLLNLTLEQKTKGVWLSGIEEEGEFKRWHENDQLSHHYFLKNGK